GTENVVGAVGFQKAVALAIENKTSRIQRYKQYKASFLSVLKENDISFQLNGEQESTVASIFNISFTGTNVDALLTNFDLSVIVASSWSACTDGSVEPSHVLTSMFGKENPRTTNTIRCSFGIANTTENVQEAANRVVKIVKRLTM